MDNDGGLNSPIITDELNITLTLLAQQHKQNMEMIDKIIELKRLQLGIKEEVNDEVSD